MATILAQDFTTVVRSSDPQNLYTGSPMLTRLSSGRMIASFEWFCPSPVSTSLPGQFKILVSDDRGESWSEKASLSIIWPSLFVHDDFLYVIGSRPKSREIVISRSGDGGETFTQEKVLYEGRFHNAPTPVVMKDGFVYSAFETCPTGHRSEWNSLVIAGDQSGDLLDPSAWRMSNHLDFPGVPPTLTKGFYKPSFEDKIAEDSWLEGNVIDVGGEIRVILRTIIDAHSTAGLAAVCGLEDDGKQLSYRFLQFYPMPGAQCKFYIVYDDASGLFWTTVTRPTNTWQDREPLKKIGFAGAPGNERRILILMYSLDALNWFDAGCVAMSRSPLESFSYASQLIDGDDLLVIARTSQGGKNQHDTNLVTLHRVVDFRNLALELRPDI